MNRPGPPSKTKEPHGEPRRADGAREKRVSSCEGLLEEILERDNLNAAWKRVRRNGGVAGIDGMEISEFRAFIAKYGDLIRKRLAEGTYMPSPARRVEIPKLDGTKRPLGIPTVLDRVIQQAIAQILIPIYDPEFSEHSYGFRPGRKAHDAIRHVLLASKGERKKWAVDCDLKSFFDTVNHDVLMERLRHRIKDRRVLSLIGKYLRAGIVMPDGSQEPTLKGVPQGGPLSPLLANILLDDLDRELEKRRHTFARYADDFVILCRSQRAAGRVMESIGDYIERQLKLVVNRTKSRVCELHDATFLGFTIVKNRIRWSEKSARRFKSRLHEITKRTRGVSPAQVMEELRRFVRGAVNYYALGMPHRNTRELDQWMRRRVRFYYWKQWGRPRTRRRNLIALGINRDRVHLASRSRKGPWRMSQNSLVKMAMTNEWLVDQGVPQIEQQWTLIRYPDGPKRGRRMKP